MSLVFFFLVMPQLTFTIIIIIIFFFLTRIVIYTAYCSLFQIFIICLASGSLLLGGLSHFLKRRRRNPLAASRKQLRDARQRFINSRASNFGNYKFENFSKIVVTIILAEYNVCII